MPTGVSWKALLGAGCLGGIGFTMSLFIASLALEGQLLDSGKIGTLAGSTVSAVIGYLLLLTSLPRASADVTALESAAGMDEPHRHATLADQSDRIPQ
jgi:NhaA family Na+:H+ antiporter